MNAFLFFAHWLSRPIKPECCFDEWGQCVPGKSCFLCTEHYSSMVLVCTALIRPAGMALWWANNFTNCINWNFYTLEANMNGGEKKYVLCHLPNYMIYTPLSVAVLKYVWTYQRLQTSWTLSKHGWEGNCYMLSRHQFVPCGTMGHTFVHRSFLNFNLKLTAELDIDKRLNILREKANHILIQRGSKIVKQIDWPQKVFGLCTLYNKVSHHKSNLCHTL